MNDRLLPQVWMLQSREIRMHLATVFDVPKTGAAEIRDSDVISDGHTYEDLAIITGEAMANYVGSEETFNRLWELTVAKARFELNPPVGTITGAPKTLGEEVTPTETPVEELATEVVAHETEEKEDKGPTLPPQPQRGRPKKS